MAVLSNQLRKNIVDNWQRDLSRDQESTGGITKGEVRAALNTLDDNLETNWTLLTVGIPLRVSTDFGDRLLLDLFSEIIKRRALRAGRVR